MIWLSLLTTLALAAPCTLSTPDGADFRRTSIRADDVHLVIELYATDTTAAQLRAQLDVLESRGVKAALVTDSHPAPEVVALLKQAVIAGHEVVLLGEVREIKHRSDAVTADWKELRREAKTLRKRIDTRPVAFAGTIPTRVSEAVVSHAGFPTMLPEDRLPSAKHTQAGRLEGTVIAPVTLPGGPYSAKSCSGTPHVAGFDIAAADRAAAALQEASGQGGAPVVRLALHRPVPQSADVLARWLDEVVLPAGVSIETPSALRVKLVEMDSSGIAATSTGRRVLIPEVQAAAKVLTTTTTIPRQLPGDLNPTELFVALLKLTTGDTVGNAVQLPPIAPPVELARSGLTGPVTVSPADVEAFATALLAGLPSQLPNAMPVGGTLLTTPELLLLLANHVTLGQATTQPVTVPEPSAPGLGWGRSGRG